MGKASRDRKKTSKGLKASKSVKIKALQGASNAPKESGFGILPSCDLKKNLGCA